MAIATRGSVISESFTRSSELSARSSSAWRSVKPSGGGDLACAPCCSSRMSCARTRSLNCWSRMTIIAPPCATYRIYSCAKLATTKLLWCGADVNRTFPFFLRCEISGREGRRSKPSILLALQLELRSEVQLRLRRHRGVVAEFHRVGALSAGDRPQPRLVFGNFGE